MDRRSEILIKSAKEKYMSIEPSNVRYSCKNRYFALYVLVRVVFCVSSTPSNLQFAGEYGFAAFEKSLDGLGEIGGF